MGSSRGSSSELPSPAASVNCAATSSGWLAVRTSRRAGSASEKPRGVHGSAWGPFAVKFAGPPKKKELEV